MDLFTWAANNVLASGGLEDLDEIAREASRIMRGCVYEGLDGPPDDGTEARQELRATVATARAVYLWLSAATLERRPMTFAEVVEADGGLISAADESQRLNAARLLTAAGGPHSVVEYTALWFS